MDIGQNCYETREQELLVQTESPTVSIALVKSEKQLPGNVFLTPSAVERLVEQNIKVYIQFGFADNNPFSDADYADAGAEFVEKFADLAILSKILLKYNAFTDEQILLAGNEKILFSVELSEHTDARYIKLINGKRHTAIAACMAKSEGSISIIDKIHADSLSDFGLQIAISSFLQPYVEILAHSPNISYALQVNSGVIDMVYTHKSWLCSREIAESLALPWRDLLSLCWDLN